MKQSAFRPATKTKTNNLGAWLQSARLKLAVLEDQSGVEAQALLAHVLDKPRAWLLAHPEVALSPHQQAVLDGLLDSLISGTPLPYLTGQQEFYGLAFHVSPNVLIPRPETELLVEQALNWLKAHPQRRTAADVGVGSGCITVTLTQKIPDLCVLACDRSSGALATARANARLHQVDGRISFLQSDLLSACSTQFDLVCANLPYIPSTDLPRLEVSRHEPLLALDGGPDGLALIAQLLADAPRWLAPAGLMLLEIEYRQGQKAALLAQHALPKAQVNILKDYSGLDRFVKIEREET